MFAKTTIHAHVSGLSGNWKTDFYTHGRMKISKRDIDQYEKGKFRLKERKVSEIASTFNGLKTLYFPDTISVFSDDHLSVALQKARQLMYRTHLQVSDGFNKQDPDFFCLEDTRVLVPAFIDSQNKTKGIGIHTEGGKGVRKIQALTYMPSSIRGMLTLYRLFNTNLQIFDNRTLYAQRSNLEQVTINDMEPNQMPIVFMVDGRDGTAHSAEVCNADETSSRIIWTIILNGIQKERLAKLIPDYEKWLEDDIARYAKSEKRKVDEIVEYLGQYSLNDIA